MPQSSLVKIALADLTFDIPDAPNGLHKSTISKIANAWKRGTLIDTRGVLWVKVDELWLIWRTDKPTATELYLKIPTGKFRKEISGAQYVRGCEVLKYIAYRLESATHTKRKGLIFAKNIFDRVQDEPELQLIIHEAQLALQSARKKLKRERISQLSLKCDELTGDKLIKRSAQFAHIISAESDLDLADQIWNGVIVNKMTHHAITSNKITNGDDLFDFCHDQGWNIDWYEPWYQKLQNFYTS